MPSIRVLIADDHALVREGVAALLTMHPDFEVVGQACDGREAVDKSIKLRPDVVLMDIAMPGLGGLEATLEIRKKSPNVRILILSQYDDREYVHRFLKAGACGYILKKALGAELLNAVRAVLRGERYLDPAIAGQVVDDLIGGRGAGDDAYESLTDRERQVLKLIAEELTHKEIAKLLGISEKTAVAHHSNLSNKLGLRTKVELTKFAIQKGIIKL